MLAHLSLKEDGFRPFFFTVFTLDLASLNIFLPSVIVKETRSPLLSTCMYSGQVLRSLLCPRTLGSALFWASRHFSNSNKCHLGFPAMIITHFCPLYFYGVNVLDLNLPIIEKFLTTQSLVSFSPLSSHSSFGTIKNLFFFGCIHLEFTFSSLHIVPTTNLNNHFSM